MQTSFSHHGKEWGVILGFSMILFILWGLPTGFEKQIYLNAEGVKAKIIEVNNHGVYLTGMIQQGEQRCLIEILDGVHQGKIVEGINLLTGKLEVDKIFEVGDVAWTLLEINEKIYDALVDLTFTVEQDLNGDGQKKHHTVHFIDWKNVDNNDFLVVRKFEVQTLSGKSIFPDIVIFINGIPVVVLEAKSPFLEKGNNESIGKKQAFEQLRSYCKIILELLHLMLHL